MTDRYVTIGGYGDGSSLSQAGPISSINTQIASAISGGGTPRILIVANRGPYPVPMKKPGNLASDNSSSDTLNDGAVYTINADTSAATSEVVIEGMSDDLTPLEQFCYRTVSGRTPARTRRTAATRARAALTCSRTTSSSATSSSGTSATPSRSPAPATTSPSRTWHWTTSGVASGSRAARR